MYAVVRLNHFDTDKLTSSAADVAEFDRIHGEQPGFIGSLIVDVGDGKQATVNLWDSAESAQAALPRIGPVVARLLSPLMKADSQLLGTGTVIKGADLIKQ
ncbi:hypothetical protein ONR57_13490 [Hoyosella sp. YIM 151337]|uniref:hypothetical protein n=1 Tax=Hoyosella sp. YIM 151337 TaxID=2992742 RepID=UPI00223618DD|nr:hypothetical protein [Hoyosella sp. YIM 151337]MCW4354315.1 hypothetical protein [Hoyosella sp. YIM 151337]